jgi:hypothetical protein
MESESRFLHPLHAGWGIPLLCPEERYCGKT